MASTLKAKIFKPTAIEVIKIRDTFDTMKKSILFISFSPGGFDELPGEFINGNSMHPALYKFQLKMSQSTFTDRSTPLALIIIIIITSNQPSSDKYKYANKKMVWTCSCMQYEA